MKKQKKTLAQYGFGGDTGKKVTKVPDGYTEDDFVDPNFPNRKYYKKESTVTTPAKVVVKPISTPHVNRINKGTNVARATKSLPKTQSFLDRVFTEPEQAIVPAVATAVPAKAFMGDIIMDTNQHAVGMLRNPTRKSANITQAGTLDTSNEDAEFMYLQPNSNKPDYNRGSYKLNNTEIQDIFGTNRTMTKDVAGYKNKSVAKFATGGQAGFDWSGLAGAVPGIADGIMALLDTNPNAYSKQPLINASAARNMASPYAYGGTIDDLDEDELTELQQQAQDNGVSIEEMFDMVNQEQPQEEVTDEDVEVEEEEEAPVEEEGGEGGQLSLGNLFNQQEFAMGGKAGNVNINVEDKEAVQTPDGQTVQMKGKTHEKGGIDITVPKGTKIFSDRLSIDGKTMQQRKIKREKLLGKVNGILKARPVDALIKNTVARTNETLGAEDAQDMQLQNVANKIYAPPVDETAQSHAYGGVATPTFAGGGTVYPGNRKVHNYSQFTQGGVPFAGSYSDFLNMGNGNDYGFKVPFKQGYREPVQTVPINTGLNPVAAPTPTGPATGMTINPTMNLPQIPNANMQLRSKLTNPQPTFASKLKSFANKAGQNIQNNAGDYVGMAGNMFNAIAPIINTRNAAKNTKPNVNRFLGFGKNALDANQSAIDSVAGIKNNQMIDASTSANSSYARNVNGASSVNTLRALDATTDMGKAKTQGAIQSNFASQMINLLGQRGNLLNQKDTMEMRGATARDTEDKADSDNFYSNMAQNLTNFGTNVQGIGGALNVSKSNRVNANMVSQLSKYGLDLDEEGNLINRKGK